MAKLGNRIVENQNIDMAASEQTTAIRNDGNASTADPSISSTVLEAEQSNLYEQNPSRNLCILHAAVLPDLLIPAKSVRTASSTRYISTLLSSISSTSLEAEQSNLTKSRNLAGFALGMLSTLLGFVYFTMAENISATKDTNPLMNCLMTRVTMGMMVMGICLSLVVFIFSQRRLEHNNAKKEEA